MLLSYKSLIKCITCISAQETILSEHGENRNKRTLQLGSDTVTGKQYSRLRKGSLCLPWVMTARKSKQQRIQNRVWTFQRKLMIPKWASARFWANQFRHVYVCCDQSWHIKIDMSSMCKVRKLSSLDHLMQPLLNKMFKDQWNNNSYKTLFVS